MAMTEAQYKEHLMGLLPRGLAWSRLFGSVLSYLMSGIAAELARIDARGDNILREVIPTSTVELIAEWEATCGLPDPCITAAQTLEERRNAVKGVLTNSGGQSRQFFIDLAAALGYTITITEYRPFRVGFSAVGDALSNGDWAFTWLVTSPAGAVTYFRAGISAVGDPLVKFNDELLECVFNKLKPAHTLALFAYA